MSESCAGMLREDDSWDLAVAELTTQVLVVRKCEEGGYKLYNRG